MAFSSVPFGPTDFGGFFAVHESPKEFDKIEFKHDIDNYLNKVRTEFVYPKFLSLSNYSDREKYLSELKGLLNDGTVSEKKLLEKIQEGIRQFIPTDSGICSLLAEYRSRLEYWSYFQTEMTEGLSHSTQATL